MIARGPLGCVFEYAKPEIADVASKKLSEITIAPLEDYRIFEVLRDINRKCVIIDIAYDDGGVGFTYLVGTEPLMGGFACCDPDLRCNIDS